MLPDDAQWRAFFRKFQDRTGLDLSQYKPRQLQRRILGIAESRGAGTLSELWRLLSGSETELRWFHDKLAINVSGLFRNPEKWKELEAEILPTLAQRSAALNCWSAGCSYGAEAHTLAMLLDANFPGPSRVLGTDIDETALEQARRGEFSDEDMRNVSDDLRRRYFLPRTVGGWQAKTDLRRYLTFRREDLLTGPVAGGFDLIVCRNVVIYFTESAKNTLYQRFYRALKPGGVLFVGSTERIFNAKELGFTTSSPLFYQKPFEGPALCRNAS